MENISHHFLFFSIAPQLKRFPDIEVLFHDEIKRQVSAWEETKGLFLKCQHLNPSMQWQKHWTDHDPALWGSTDWLKWFQLLKVKGSAVVTRHGHAQEM